MDGGEQTTISPEFLENIQSAVNSQGVLGQVQVIETENGPVTVLFMEEGADVSSFGGENITLSVDGTDQALSETVIGDDDTQVQYQYHVQTDDDYSQLLQGAVGDTIVSVADTVVPVKEDLAVEPVIDLPPVTPEVQPTVTETFEQPEGDTSTDTYYITDTGEILKIDSSLLGENAGDATLQLQTQDGTLQILNQVGNIQTTQEEPQLTTYTQPAVDNLNITYNQSSPSFEYTATKVDGQAITETPRAEEPKVLSYKTTNRQRTNIMRQPVSKPSIQPRPAASSQTSLLQPQYSTIKQANAGNQTTEIVCQKPYQKQTIVFPKVQKPAVNTNVIKVGQQSYQVKTPPQKMITTVMKPQSLLKSNVSNYMTSTSAVNKPGFTQIPVTTRGYTTSTLTQKQVPAVNKIQSQAIGTGVTAVTKQQTDLLSVAMKQAEVSHQIVPPTVPEVKKVITPAIVKEPVLSIQKSELLADPVNIVKTFTEQLEPAKESVGSPVHTSNDTTVTVAEKTTSTEETETVPMDVSQENINILPPENNIEPQSGNSTESKTKESKMETDEQPVDGSIAEEGLTSSETDKPGPDSSSKKVSINRFSEKNLQDKSKVKTEMIKTENIQVSNVKNAVKVTTLAKNVFLIGENDANNDSKKNKHKVLHTSKLKGVKIPTSDMSGNGGKTSGKNIEKENERVITKKADKVITKKARNLPIKKVLKCESCPFMTGKKSILNQHLLERHNTSSLTEKSTMLQKVEKLKVKIPVCYKPQPKKFVKSFHKTPEQNYYFELSRSKKNKNVKCKICRQVVPRETFVEHLVEVHVSDTFSCGKCMKIFISEVDRLNHVIEGSCKLGSKIGVHSDKEANLKKSDIARDDVNDNSARSKKFLDVGLEYDNNKKDKLSSNLPQGIYLYRCPSCKFSFMTEYILERHLRKCGSAAEVSYLSLVQSYRDKIRHVKPNKLPTPHRCLECNKSFLSLGKLRFHSLMARCGIGKLIVPSAGFTESNSSNTKSFHKLNDNENEAISVTEENSAIVTVTETEDVERQERIIKTQKLSNELYEMKKAVKGLIEIGENKKENETKKDMPDSDLHQQKGTSVNEDELECSDSDPLLNDVPLSHLERKQMDMVDSYSTDSGDGTAMNQSGTLKNSTPNLKVEEYEGDVPKGLDLSRPLVTPYQCGGCNVLCVGELHFRRHMQSLHTEGLQCKICEKKSNEQVKLEGHMIDKHLIGHPLTCPDCYKTFKKLSAYWRHAIIHVKRFTCGICNRSFKTKAQLTTHFQVHMEVNNELCVRCGKVFDTHDLLRIHSWKEHGVAMNRRKIPLHVRAQRRSLMLEQKKVQLTLNLSKKNEESTAADAGKQAEDSMSTAISKPSDEPSGPSLASSSGSNMKSIDVPDSDVTIQLFADGTLVTRDKAGTNYSQVKLEDLGLDLSMLEGNTDIELLIVQGDGKEVRATINTSQHVNPTTQSLTPVNKGSSATTVASSMSGTKLTPSSSSTERSTAVVNEARPYKCSMCPRTFKFYRTYRCHEIVHTKAVTFTCHLCQRLFAREVNLQSHLELHKKKGSMRPTDEQKIVNNECKKCQRFFSSVHALQRHVKEQHEDHERIPCPICGKLFKNETNVQRHSKIHVGPFTCPHCVKVYTERTEYYEHIKSEHEDLMYPCKECNAILPSRRAFINHTRTQHNNLDDLIDSMKGKECTICQKKFERESELEAHLVVHTSERTHECPACGKKYKLLNTLEKHIKEIHKNDVVFTCSECDEKFEYKGKLDLHVKLFHTGTYQCLTCYEDFPERTLLEEHQYNDHDFALVCSKCKSKFDTSLKLKNHLKEHISQNNLCDICGAGFEHKAQLRSHLVNKHFGREKTSMLKQYPSMGNVNIEIVCDLCGEYWHNKPLYKQHLRDVHFGGDTVEMLKLFPTFEKIPDPPEPVTCDHCGKKCASMTQLNFHLKTHVKSKRKSVQTEPEDFSSLSEEENEDPYDFTNIEPRELDKNYKCKKCDSQFTRKAALVKHMSVHKKDEFKEALKTIEKEETARAELEELVGYKPTPRVKKAGKRSLKKTPQQGKIKLPFPKAKVESPTSPDSTPSKRKTSKMHICSTCEETFKTLEELNEHVSNEHGDEVEMKSPSTAKVVEFDLQAFLCKSCNKAFSSRKNLRKHLRGVHKYLEKAANSNELFKCTECEREFTLKSNMARHMMAKHDINMEEEGVESPPKSRKKLKKVNVKLDEDSNESMDEDSTTDITSFLGKNFNLGKTHACNIQSVKKKQHKCNLCGEAFSRDATLKKHMALHATEEDVGSKYEFDDLSDLQPAIYTCLTCGNKYSTGLGLIHHTRVKHSEIDEETVLGHVAEVDSQLKLESPKKKLEKESNKVNKKRKLELDSEEASEDAKKRRKVVKDEVINQEGDVHKDKMQSPQSVRYSHSGRMITKSKKLSEQIHCDKCNKTFLEEKGLKQHIMRVHKVEEDVKPKVKEEDGTFKCDLCPKQYDQRINLRRHMKMKHNIELPSDTMNTSLSESPKATLVYNCDVCIQKFSKLSNLRSHMVSTHDENDEEVKSENKMQAGNTCDGEFSTGKALEVQMRKHSGERPYKCCLCNKNFISKFQLECHIKKLHPKQWAKKVKCKICLMLFETQKAMLKHKLTHRKPLDSEEQKSGKGETSQHKCSHCEKVFKWKRNLDSHIEAYHTEADPLTCGVCNKVFPDKESIKEHMTEHNKPKRDVPTCKICDKTFKKQSSLKMHIAQLHKEEATPKGGMSCDICKESFTTKMKLLEHMLTHTSVMPHKCDICSASFHLEAKLKAHKQTHKLKEKKSEVKNNLDKGKKKSDEDNDSDKKKELRFKCKKCIKKFSDILLLKAHVTKVHKKKMIIKTSLPKNRITRSRSLSESKVNPPKPGSLKEKKQLKEKEKKEQLKEKKAVKNEVKKTQSSFCKKCNLNFIKKETYENHMKTIHENGDQGKKSDSMKKADQGKSTEKKISQKGTDAADKSKKNADKKTLQKGTGNSDKSKKAEKQSTKTNTEKKKDMVGFDCPICRKIFSKQFSLKSHIRNAHKVTMEETPSDNKRTKCLFCNQCARVFWSQKQYDKHNKKFHPDMNALELDKQVMQAMGEGEIKVEPSDMAPKDADFETIQHKCEFCSVVHWTKKLFDEHMLSKHPEHAAEYGITADEDTSSPTIEFVNDSEDMMGNLLSVGLYDVSACNKLSSLPVVSIQRINGKRDDGLSPSKKSTADESSSDAESDADEYTREYKKFLQSSVIDVGENTEETETDDDKIDKSGTDGNVEKNKTDDNDIDEPVRDEDREENETESGIDKTGEEIQTEDNSRDEVVTDEREVNTNEDDAETGENITEMIAGKDTTEIADTNNDENDDGKIKVTINEVDESEMEEEVKAHIDSNELYSDITDSGDLNEEDNSVSNPVQSGFDKSVEQDNIELLPENGEVQLSHVDNISVEQSENIEGQVIRTEMEKDDLSIDNCSEDGEQSEDIEGKDFNNDTEKNDKEGSEIDKEQERIDWEAIDNDIEAACNEEEVSDDDNEDEEKDDIEGKTKDDESESGQENLISNEEPVNEIVNDYETESDKVQGDNLESIRTDNLESIQTVNLESIQTDNLEDIQTDNSECIQTDNLESIQTDNLESIQTDNLETIQTDNLENVQTDNLETFQTDNLESIQTDDISEEAHEENKHEDVEDVCNYELENVESSVEIGNVESSIAESSNISEWTENQGNDEIVDSGENILVDEVQDKDTILEEEIIPFESQDIEEAMDTS